MGVMALTLDAMLDRISCEMRTEAEEMILRLLPRLENQLFSTTLDEALGLVADVLKVDSSAMASQTMRNARRQERREVARQTH